MPGPVAARAREVDIIDTETRPGFGPGQLATGPRLSLGTGQCQSVPADSRYHTKCHAGEREQPLSVTDTMNLSL